MKQITWFAAALAALAWGLAPAGAEAQVQLSYQAGSGGNDSVAVLASATREGGRVHVPAGTVVSTGDGVYQDLVLGEDVEVELRAGEATTVTVPAFCMNSSRSVPSPASTMADSGAAEDAVRRIMAVSSAYSHHIVQSAVWAYRDGNAPTDELVAKVFSVAGVVVKN